MRWYCEIGHTRAHVLIAYGLIAYGSQGFSCMPQFAPPCHESEPEHCRAGRRAPAYALPACARLANPRRPGPAAPRPSSRPGRPAHGVWPWPAWPLLLFSVQAPARCAHMRMQPLRALTLRAPGVHACASSLFPMISPYCAYGYLQLRRLFSFAPVCRSRLYLAYACSKAWLYPPT